MSVKDRFFNAQELHSARNNDSMLRSAFIADAVTSLIFGLLLLIDASPLAAFLGIQHVQFFGRYPGAAILIDIGLAVTAYAVWVGYTAARRNIEKPTIIAILIANMLWVVDSILLLVTRELPLTEPGTWAVLVTADLVLALAIWEYIGFRRMK